MKHNKNIEVKNRKAEFQYFIRNKYEAGIMLTGTEVKAIREGKANMGDAYCYFYKGELYVKNMHISEYSQGTYNNHEPRRLRKLLLNKGELARLEVKAKERGFSIIPLRMYFNERGLCKMEIGLAQGKKAFNKKNTIKQRDLKRDMDRQMRRYK